MASPSGHRFETLRTVAPELGERRVQLEALTPAVLAHPDEVRWDNVAGLWSCDLVRGGSAERSDQGARSRGNAKGVTLHVTERPPSCGGSETVPAAAFALHLGGPL